MYSKDLKNWKQVGNVIDRPSQLDFMGERLTRGLFAPAINYYKGIYYVTCTDIDHDGNFVVTSKNPGGPYSDPVKLSNVHGIDPSLYFDEETDKAFILYNSNAPDRKPLYSGHRTIRMYEFDYKNLKTVGEEKQLLNGGVDLSKRPVWIEAPHIMKRNDWFYLYAAEGGTSLNHSEVVLRSKSVWGPYIPFEGNPILTQRELPVDREYAITSAGHAQFVEGPDGKWYSIFLAIRPYEGDYYNTGRETFIAPLIWENDWPMIEHGEKELAYNYNADFKEVKQRNSLPQSGNFSYKLKFKKSLGPSFLFMRTEDKSSYFLSKKTGLTLNLKPGTIAESGNPSFIGRRQQHLNSSAEIELNFSPQSENEKAGLVIIQNEGHYYFISKSINQGQNVVQLYKSVPRKNEMELLEQVPIGLGKIKMRIASIGDSYSFYISEKGKNFRLLKADLDGKFLSTKVAGGFIGCLYGMYATSSGQESANAASFKYLKYQGNDPMYR